MGDEITEYQQSLTQRINELGNLRTQLANRAALVDRMRGAQEEPMLREMIQRWQTETRPEIQS